jgi:4-methylaminobutanoate oxidase (formaldehyde-forming)
MEKGYLYWSSDITPETNPYEAGLGFCVSLDKGDFLGRAALERVKAEGPRRKLVTLTVDGFAPFHGGETIVHDGKVVGSVTSAGFGHTVGKTIAFGYVPSALSSEPGFDLVAFGDTWRAVRGGRSLYDPKNERLRG